MVAIGRSGGALQVLEADVASYGEVEERNRKLALAMQENNDGTLSGKGSGCCGMAALCTMLGSVLPPTRTVQVAQVLLTLPYSFAQLSFLSGVIIQIFYGVVLKLVGLAFSCTYLLFGAVIQLIACGREWTFIFGACCLLTTLVPSFRNYRLWSFFGLLMISYTAWYMTVAALLQGQVENVTRHAPTTLVLYFTGATNMLFTFGGHAVTVEIMHAMNKPVKFKFVYVFATLYVFTLTIPSAVAVYWAFGDNLLQHANALALFPKTRARDIAVILMLIHQYFMWEKLIGMHTTKSLLLRAVSRIPVLLPIWFLAVAFPFFGPSTLQWGPSSSMSFLARPTCALSWKWRSKKAKGR